MAEGAFDFGGHLQTDTLVAGEALTRIHQASLSPLWFGPPPGSLPVNRFDAPAGQFRTLYAALNLTGAFVETILHRPTGAIVRRAIVEQRARSALRLTRDLTLASLHGSGLRFHNAPQAVTSGTDYPQSRAFALAFFEQFPKIDGLIYRSSHNDDELCVALFDRIGSDALEIANTQRLSDIPSEVDNIMLKHRAAFDTSPPVPPFSKL